jgi:hypothetical protein
MINQLVQEFTTIHCFCWPWRISGWWFGTMEFYDLPFSWECHHPNWLSIIFQRGRSTTNQICILLVSKIRHDMIHSIHSRCFLWMFSESATRRLPMLVNPSESDTGWLPGKSGEKWQTISTVDPRGWIDTCDTPHLFWGMSIWCSQQCWC